MPRRWPMPIVLVLFCVAAIANRGHAEELTATIIEHGRYTSKAVGAVPAEGETSGSVHILTTESVHVATTRKIPCAVGEDFGFVVKFSGLEVGRQYKLQKLTQHPPIQQPDGRIFTRSTSEDVVVAPAAEAILFVGWIFAEGYEYELMPGKWKCSVMIDENPPVEMTFDVVDPNSLDNPARQAGKN